jgi:hypothetical protein
MPVALAAGKEREADYRRSTPVRAADWLSDEMTVTSDDTVHVLDGVTGAGRANSTGSDAQ